jgi:hypothetical protein
VVAFIGRSGWGAAPPNRESEPRDRTDYVFVHHFGVAKPASLEDAKAQMRAIQADHLTRTYVKQDGTVDYWADFAYNVACDGTHQAIFEGRGWGVKSGATGPGEKVPSPFGSWDYRSVGIAMFGNFQTGPFTIDDEITLLAAFREVRLLYGNDLKCLGDRDVNYTSCCGDNLYSQLPRLWAASFVSPFPPDPIPPIPPKDLNMPDYIIRLASDPYAPWIAVYPDGALRHFGKGEAGYLLDPARHIPVIDETDADAHKRNVRLSGSKYPTAE